MFQKQCRINEGQNFENGSVASSVKSVCSLGNTDICAFGDDFMRWLISYDVFKADHTDNMGKKPFSLLILHEILNFIPSFISLSRS